MKHNIHRKAFMPYEFYQIVGQYIYHTRNVKRLNRQLRHKRRVLRAWYANRLKQTNELLAK